MKGAIESGIVSLSSCQEQWCIVLLCLAEVCASSRVETQNESAGVDINTYPLAVISTRESDMMLRTKLAPLNRLAKGKRTAHLNGSLFTNNAIAEKHFQQQVPCLGIVFESHRLQHSSSTMICNIG